MSALSNVADRLSGDAAFAHAHIVMDGDTLSISPKTVGSLPSASLHAELLEPTSMAIEVGQETHYDVDARSPAVIEGEILSLARAVVHEGFTETLWVRDGVVIASRVQFADGSHVSARTFRSRRGAAVRTVSYAPYPPIEPIALRGS